MGYAEFSVSRSKGIFMSKIKSVNDFVIKFANVNGSGSASANQMFAKGVFRSGIPVSPKNIFPSNIQGLPTWLFGKKRRNRYFCCYESSILRE